MATKNIFSYQGQDYSFVDQVPEDLVCPICHELLDEPQQTPCGHLFCQKCLTKVNQTNSPYVSEDLPFMRPELRRQGWANQRYSGNQMGQLVLGSQRQQKCPICNTMYTQIPTNDKYNERRVKSLRVHCTYSSESCHWVGTLAQAQEHLDSTCEYHTVSCTMNCGQEVTRHHLQNHIQNDCPERMVQCKYCLINLKYGHLHDHYQSCKKVTQTCPNNCGTSNILTENMEDHLSECQEQVVDCIYKRIGCKKQIKRKDRQKHKDNSKDNHLELSLEQISVLTEAFVDQQTKQKMNVPKQVKVELSSFLRLDREIPPHSSSPPSPGLSSQVHPQKVSPPPKYPPSTLMVRPWLENSKLFPSLPWIIRLDSPLKQKAMVYRGPLYTGVKGYVMYLQIHSNEETDKDFSLLSVNTILLCGPNDNDLSWPLRQDTSITLLNQLEDRNHYVVKEGSEDINPVIRIPQKKISAVGIAGRISHKGVYQPRKSNCVYFRDDCLYFKVALHTTHHRSDPDWCI